MCARACVTLRPAYVDGGGERGRGPLEISESAFSIDAQPRGYSAVQQEREQRSTQVCVI